MPFKLPVIPDAVLGSAIGGLITFGGVVTTLIIQGRRFRAEREEREVAARSERVDQQERDDRKLLQEKTEELFDALHRYLDDEAIWKAALTGGLARSVQVDDLRAVMIRSLRRIQMLETLYFGFLRGVTRSPGEAILRYEPVVAAFAYRWNTSRNPHAEIADPGTTLGRSYAETLEAARELASTFEAITRVIATEDVYILRAILGPNPEPVSEPKPA